MEYQSIFKNHMRSEKVLKFSTTSVQSGHCSSNRLEVSNKNINMIQISFHFKKLQERFGGASLLHTWWYSTRAFPGTCKQSLTAREAILNIGGWIWTFISISHTINKLLLKVILNFLPRSYTIFTLTPPLLNTTTTSPPPIPHSPAPKPPR